MAIESDRFIKVLVPVYFNVQTFNKYPSVYRHGMLIHPNLNARLSQLNKSFKKGATHISSQDFLLKPILPTHVYNDAKRILRHGLRHW